jgi:hypothetical protein
VSGLRSTYVDAARATRTGLDRVGLLPRLDRWAERSRTGLWTRSLLAIYDFEDLAGLGVPWWTFESIAWVDGFLGARTGARVLEWGSGSSTLWLAARAGHVTSIEYDASFAELVRARIPANVDLRVVEPVTAPPAGPVARSAKAGFEHLEFAPYVGVADELALGWDLVVVDGRARGACLGKALEVVAPDGVVLVDNVERDRNRDAVLALGNGVDVVWTRGLTPCLPYPSGTALVRRR